MTHMFTSGLVNVSCARMPCAWLFCIQPSCLIEVKVVVLLTRFKSLFETQQIGDENSIL